MRQVAEDEGRTILYVSHNMRTIRQLCNRCIVLDHGKIIFDGDPEKAIAIYMPKANEEAYQDIWHLDDIARPGKMKDDYRITEFIFSGKGGYEIAAGTDLQFNLGIRAKKANEFLCFRTVLFYEDDSPIGMASTIAGGLTVTEGDNLFTGICPTATLAPGDYKLKLVIYEVDGYGSETLCDVIDRIVLFTITGDKTTNGIPWQHMWWGHNTYPQLLLTPLE